MISSIEVQNIRLFDENNWKFLLRPLTIFCGTNSSGKSTLLKTLLLLKQSMGIGENFEARDGRLRFIGSQVDLGDYSTYVSHNDVYKDISIGITTSYFMPLEAAIVLDPSIKLANAKADDQSGEKQKHDSSDNRIKYSLHSKFLFGLRDQNQTTEATITKVSRDTSSETHKGYLKLAEFELSISGKLLASWFVEYGGSDDDGDPKYFLFIQEDFFNRANKEGLPELVIDNTTKPGFVKVNTVLSGLTPGPFFIAQLAQKGENEEESDTDGRWKFFQMPEIIYNVTKHLKDSLGDIDYLGPLRSPAKRYYITQSDYIPSSDPAGEFLPSVLRDMDKYEAWYIPPKSYAVEVERAHLMCAFNIWLHYIRTGEVITEGVCPDEISLEATKVLLEFRIKSFLGDELHALSDSGFGYSQLLPILVRALTATPSSTVIIEQPELHLNPAIQVRMAEFLMAMTQAGKQIIVETHSEHIVNTVRVLTAEDEKGQLAKLSKIFYIEAISKRPVIHELSVQPDGIVPKWPQQFFGEAANLTGRLLRAQKRFKKKIP